MGPERVAGPPVHRGVGAQPIRSEWQDRWDQQEEALRHRLGKNVDRMEAKAHDLKPLDLLTHVRVQNQTGNAPRRWDRTGVVVGRRLALDKYWVKMDGSRRVTERNRKFLRQFQPATTGLEERYRAPQVTPVGRAQQKQDIQKQDTPARRDAEVGRGDDVNLQARGGIATRQLNNGTTPARSPATPEFITPRSSPLATPLTAGRTGTDRGTPRPAGRPAVRRKVTFNLEQGETAEPEQGHEAQPRAATEPPPQVVPPTPEPQAATQPPASAYDRPRREVKRPAWQRDFDMSASAVAVHCSGVDNAEADNSVVGVSGYVKDDYSAAETQTTGQFERSPPDGGCTVARVAAILHSVVQEASRLLAVLANYGDEEIDQAVVKNGAVIKNGGD